MRRENSYHSRLRDETSRYESCLDVHHLPPIFHYWSNRYIRPKLAAFGIDGPDHMFRDHLATLCTISSTQPRRFLSIGSGNCDLEVRIAASLRAEGHSDFSIECLDLNQAMLERGRQAALEAGVVENIRLTQADFNSWDARRTYDAVIANQSLHHVLNLESLFGQVDRALAPDALFLISDMVGRNGHQRWPEALAIVDEFWTRLPPSFRYNQTLKRYEEVYGDWDCSTESFEGIRSQDILPLLLRRFHAHLFVGFGSAVDVFTDRRFGFHFDASADWDRRFIDEVHARDEAGFREARLTPTHMIAIFGRTPAVRPQWNLEPQKCIRNPDTPGAALPASPRIAGYEWKAWPHDKQTELEIACGHLAELQEQIRRFEFEVQQRTEWAQRLELEMEDRTEWAQRLERDVESRTEWATALNYDLDKSASSIRALQTELEVRTLWARSLERESDARAVRVQELDQELRGRTEWAQRVQTELDEERRLRHALEAAFRSPRRLALYFARRIGRRFLRMLGNRR